MATCTANTNIEVHKYNLVPGPGLYEVKTPVRDEVRKIILLIAVSVLTEYSVRVQGVVVESGQEE